MIRLGLEPRSVASKLPDPAPCHTAFPTASLLPTHTHASALAAPVQMEKHPTGVPGIAIPISRPASPGFRKNQGLQLEHMPILASQPKPWPVPPSTQDLGLLSILVVGEAGGSRAPLPGPRQGKFSKALLPPHRGTVGKLLCFLGLSLFIHIMGMLTSAGLPHKAHLNDSVLMLLSPALILA